MVKPLRVNDGGWSSVMGGLIGMLVVSAVVNHVVLVVFVVGGDVVLLYCC